MVMRSKDEQRIVMVMRRKDEPEDSDGHEKEG